MRVNHPDTGRFDRTHGDEGKTGPVLTGATVAALDDEVDRLTEERDMLRAALKSLLDAHAQHSIKTAIQHYGTAHEKQAHATAREQARAALAKLEEE